jgi:DNA-binding CsgD family transcriptional regulator/N-acetylneuraminic acid mutarotase
MEPNPREAPVTRGAPGGAELSEREHEILRLVATGASNKQIAQQLVISPNTVKVHLRNIFSKIGAASRTEAALYAMREGLVQIEVVETGDREPPTPAADSGPLIVPVTRDSLLAGTAVAPAAQRLPRWAGIGGLLVAVLVLVVVILLTRSTQQTATPTVSPPTPMPQWQSRAQMPTARSGLAATAYADQAYLMGGEGPNGLTGANERYDPASNSWTALANMPAAAADIDSAAIGGLIYVPGGRLASGEITSTLQVYDPRQDHWEQRAPLPLPLSGYALAVYEGKLYVFGGWTGDHFVNSVYAYDPLSNAWASHAAMPTARGFGGAALAAGKIFVMGGTAGGPALAVNEAFSPDAETSGGAAWAPVAAMPSGRIKAAIASVADIVHVVGGDGITGPQTALEYLPQLDQWKEIESPKSQPWSRMGLVAIGTNLYAFGGLVGQSITGAQWTYQALYTIAVPIVQ